MVLTTGFGKFAKPCSKINKLTKNKKVKKHRGFAEFCKPRSQKQRLYCFAKSNTKKTTVLSDFRRNCQSTKQNFFASSLFCSKSISLKPL